MLQLLWQEYRACSILSMVLPTAVSVSGTASYETYIAGQEESGFVEIGSCIICDSFANAYSLCTRSLQTLKIRCTPFCLHVRITLSEIIIFILESSKQPVGCCSFRWPLVLMKHSSSNRPFQMRAWSCITSYPLRGLQYVAYDNVNPAMVSSMMLRSSMHAFEKVNWLQ